MYIRFPTQRTPPSLLSFVVFLAGAVCVVVGISLLGVGTWLYWHTEQSAGTVLTLGGAAVGFGCLTVLGGYLARRLLP